MLGCEEETSIMKDPVKLHKLLSVAVSQFNNSKTESSITSLEEPILSIIAKCDHDLQLHKESIRELLCIQKTELSVLEEVRSLTMGGQANQILCKITQANRRQVEVEKEIATAVSSVSHLEQLENQLNTRIKSLSQKATTSIPKLKADISAFMQISHLKWDYGAPENVVKGFIYQLEKKDIVSFKFDKSVQSQFFITNFLWDQIGADNDFF
ncbi:hypothetical protein OTU49_008392 [Cherax quadricarinatus]|uniref:Kinetochore protein Spc24 n=1 Tax=Cherax quadricarinatus TaxID=27406 RepID=A0AAW0WCW9_CHEQU|nr:uncharacterized protein LOC128705511 [Cherax quadricarinatus]